MRKIAAMMVTPLLLSTSKVRGFAALAGSIRRRWRGVFAAVAIWLVISDPTPAPGSDPCEGGGYNPTPTSVAVNAVPIEVTSTTDDYFVLYVTHDLDGAEVKIPVLVKRGEDGATTLSENVAALPADRYRVEKYRISDPADVDGDCVDDVAELAAPDSLNPVNPAGAIAASDGAVSVPDRQAYDALAVYRTFKFIIRDWDADRPKLYFINAKQFPLPSGPPG